MDNENIVSKAQEMLDWIAEDTRDDIEARKGSMADLPARFKAAVDGVFDAVNNSRETGIELQAARNLVGSQQRPFDAIWLSRLLSKASDVTTSSDIAIETAAFNIAKEMQRVVESPGDKASH